MSQLDELDQLCKATKRVKIAAYDKRGRRLTADVVQVDTLNRTVTVENVHWSGPRPKDPARDRFSAIELGLVSVRSGRKRRRVIACISESTN